MNKKIICIITMISLLVMTIFAMSGNVSAATNDTQTSKEYKYTQNVDCAPRFALYGTNKNYLLITFRDYVGIETKSIEVCKYNTNTKKYDIKLSTTVIKENYTEDSTKKTTIKILRKNISTKSETVRLRIAAHDTDKNPNKVLGYVIVKPLAEQKNNRWFSYVSAPRMYFTVGEGTTKEANALKSKLTVNFTDNKGIDYVKIYDYNSNTPKTEKVTLNGKTSYALDLSQYTVKKSPNGKDACRIHFEVKGKRGGKRHETIYFTAKKYEVVKATSLSLNKESMTLNLDTSSKIKATVKPSNTTEIVKYTTSDKNIVTVNQEGKITPKKVGTATITAKVGNLTKTCKVTVKFVRSYEYTIYITI